MNLFCVEIRNRHTTETYVAYTEAAARQALHRYVTEHWAQAFGPGVTKPADPDEAIPAYFAQRDDEGWSLGQLRLEAEPGVVHRTCPVCGLRRTDDTTRMPAGTTAVLPRGQPCPHCHAPMTDEAHTPATPAPERIETYPYLDASTGHITPRDNEILTDLASDNPTGITIASYEGGFFVTVPPQENGVLDDEIRALRETHQMSESFVALLRLASRAGAFVVRLDRDGNEWPGLELHPW